MQPDHGQLDHIGRRALDRSIDGIALSESANGGIVAVDVAEVPPSSQKGFRVSRLFGFLDGAVHVLLDERILHEIIVDDGRGLFSGNVEPFGESEGADAVYDAEVDHLGFTAHVTVDFLQAYAEDLGGGGGMNVQVLSEGFEHTGILTEVRHDAQLDLGVVGGQQYMCRIAGYECFAYFSSPGCTDRDILQVGIVAAQPTGHCHDLVEGGMDTAGMGVHQLR